MTFFTTKSTFQGALVSVVVTLLIASFFACNSSPKKNNLASPSPQADSVQAATHAHGSRDMADLAEAMDKLQNAIEKPTAPFHVSLRKSESNGLLYQCEADVSADGIFGQQTDHSPDVKVGNDVFPANTRVRQLKGAPPGSLEWSTVRGGMEMTYLNGHIGDAQEGVKYGGDEQTGGYAARRYDFDLAGVDATIKKAMIGNALSGGRQVKDFNMKGSAWIAKDSGEMVKFQYETMYVFNDGENDTRHYEGSVTKK